MDTQAKQVTRTVGIALILMTLVIGNASTATATLVCSPPPKVAAPPEPIKPPKMPERFL
jgi:hypothetical protein